MRFRSPARAVASARLFSAPLAMPPMTKRRPSARRRVLAVVLAVGLPAAVLVASAPVSAAAGPQTRLISASGTGSLIVPASGATGGSGYEIPNVAGDGGIINDRSHSGSGAASVGAVSQPAPVTASTPGLAASFHGLDHFDQRFGSSAGGNQFSLVPPDQGLCVGSDGNGNTRVVEALNDVLQVYSADGTPQLALPTALNQFFGYAPAIVRSTKPITFGPFVTDPSCYYDAQTGHWFLDALTIDTFPHPGSDGLQHFTGTNHIDLAVSKTQNPLGGWTIYRIPVQDDGTDGTPDHHCQANTDTATPLPTNPNACLGDYPHLGADSNGIYITTNEYSLFGNNFIGAQVYAFSKAALESGAAQVAVTQINTHGADPFGFALNGFTLWPSTTPGGGGDPSAGGTEYFMSSNSAAEAHDTGDGSAPAQPSRQLLVWALTNTSSLNSTPALSLTVNKLDVGVYSQPPQATQKAGNTPQRDCLNNNACSLALNGFKDPFAETLSPLDSNDTRMQQVTWVNGRLWGALDTALSISSAKQAGIEWFNAAASTSGGSLSTSLLNQGYLGIGNDNLTYPAIGVTTGGTGVMAFTLVGNDYYPSAGYATVAPSGVGAVHFAAAGVGPEDDFSDYKVNGNPPGTTRPRWGDYGAAIPWGSNVWLASEYVANSCDFSTYKNTAFRCGNIRTAFANWDTRISEVAAP
jgi:hypothetical protein